MTVDTQNSRILTEDDKDDPLRLAFVEARAREYKLDIPAKLKLIEEMGEMIMIARRSYFEKLSISLKD